MATGVRNLRQLPRGLTPLRDESLPGYVLRLSYRLGTAPGETAVRCGLSTPHRDSSCAPLLLDLLYGPDEDCLVAFAHTTRLNLHEARSLFLAPLGDRYGPLNRALTRRRVAHAMLRHNSWVYSRWTRYCPECLQGDGSAVQKSYGGSWRRSWRLPPVFACLQHRQLLSVHCEDCGQAALGGSRTSIIPRPGDEALSPIQCRAPRKGLSRADLRPACGAQLTFRSSLTRWPDMETKEALLLVQKEVLDLLDMQGPETARSLGWLIPAPRYFMDLRVAAALLVLSWPFGTGFVATDAMRGVIEEVAGECRQACNDMRRKGGKRPLARTYSSLPDDALAAGTVVCAAAKLLAVDGPGAFDVWHELFTQARLRDPATAVALRGSPAIPISVPFKAALSLPSRRAWLEAARASELPHRPSS